MRASLLADLRTPWVFEPLFQSRVWGGTALQKLFNGATLPISCGEAWVLSAVPGQETRLNTPPHRSLSDLIAQYQAHVMGKRVWAQTAGAFPLLIKFIDAQERLSLQVHPGDALAKSIHACSGKTEMWYILDASKTAQIINGFSTTLSPAAYQTHLEAGTLGSCLNTYAAHSNDAFFIPAGQIHSIGGGVLCAEIQQSSDITYRIDDYGRKRAVPERELHREEALQALSFASSDGGALPYQSAINTAVDLVQCKAFGVRKVHCQGTVQRDLIGADSFIIYLCVEGEVSWENAYGSTPIPAGGCALVAASHAKGALKGDGVALECFVGE